MKRRKWYGAYFLPVILLEFLCLSQSAVAERRLAFVVGIDSYNNLGPNAQLQRAVTDAEAVKTSLDKLGFTTTALARGVKVTQDVFLRRFAAWTQDIQPGDIAVFYYAGHGVGMNGTNYLVPSDMPDLGDADEYLFRAHALTETEIRDRIERRGARVTLLMLDACRNNPFGSSNRAATLTRGLEPTQPTTGVLTIYAAGYGQTALDRLSDTADSDPDSVFTRVVISELQIPGLNLVDFSEDVREKVAELARSSGHEQVPAVDNQLIGGRLVFLGGAPPPTVPQGPTLEDIAWRYMEGTTDLAVLRKFIADYPEGVHRKAAEARLATLEIPPRPPAPLAVVPTPPPPPIAALSQAKVEEPVPRAPTLDDFTWARVASSETPGDVRDYLLRYPSSEHRAKAEDRLQQLDNASWKSAATGNVAVVNRYLDAFPEGRHLQSARARLAALEAPRFIPRQVPHAKVPAPRLPVRAPVVHVRVAPPVQRVAVSPRVVLPRPERHNPASVARPRASCFSFAGETHCQ